MDAQRSQAEIGRAREDVAGSLAALAGEVHDLFDARAFVERHPLAVAGVMLAAGFVLAHKPRAVATIVERLVPALALAALKPGLKSAAEEWGRKLAHRMA